MTPPPDDSKKPPRKPKDPAKPTRAKAARPDTHPIGPALADLLNPAINRGQAEVGSPNRAAATARAIRATAAPTSPPPHLARKSTPTGFGEVGVDLQWAAESQRRSRRRSAAGLRSDPGNAVDRRIEQVGGDGCRARVELAGSIFPSRQQSCVMEAEYGNAESHDERGAVPPICNRRLIHRIRSDCRTVNRRMRQCCVGSLPTSVPGVNGRYRHANGFSSVRR